jgi:uncharacterized protein (TIGR02118 family)
MYPNEPGARFDIEYYIHRHIPFIKEKMGDSCLEITLDKGISGRPGTPAPYTVVCNIFSSSMEVFLAGFGPVVAELDADVPNFTDLAATIQISDVVFEGLNK